MLSFLFLVFVPSILGVLIAPSTNLIANQIPAVSSSNNDTASLQTPGAAFCLQSVYGIDVSLDSCINAWVKMPRSLAPTTYGIRGQDLEAPLPIRYQSDDGLCVIDLRARRGDGAARGDIARGVDISNAARLIIENCMENPQRRKVGGSIYGFSSKGQLMVTVSKHRFQASCRGDHWLSPTVAACEQALQQMPANRQIQELIGQHDEPQRTAYNRLPKAYYFEWIPGHACQITVSRVPMSGESLAKWYDIWAASVDIVARCVRIGLSGSYEGLGDNGQIRVDIIGTNARETEGRDLEALE